MKSFILKLWKDPVWSKVISTGLIVIFGTLGTWFLGLWPQIKTALIAVVGAFLYQVEIPIWLILALVPCLLFFIPILQSFKSDSEPSFVKYKSDKIFGINWSWGWSPPGYYNDKYSIKDLRPRCPNCNSSLEIDDYSGELVHCINDECNWKWKERGDFNNRISHSSELNQKVWNVIDRKIHNNEY